MMEVRPDHRPELPDELARLGTRLETAAAAQIARRERVRRSLVKGVCAVVVGIPLALAAATTDVAPSAQPVAELARMQPTTPTSLASTQFVLDRVPDEGDAAGGRPCVMVPDCRATSTVSLYP